MNRDLFLCSLHVHFPIRGCNSLLLTLVYTVILDLLIKYFINELIT